MNVDRCVLGSVMKNDRFCVIQDGRRDQYQIPLALYETDSLERVLSDFYTPDWLLKLQDLIPDRVTRNLLKRHTSIPSHLVEWNLGLEIEKMYTLHQKKRRRNILFQNLNRKYSKKAARYLTKSPFSNVICYSPYWSQLSEVKLNGKWKGVGIVFVVHPLPNLVKHILSLDRKKSGLTYEPEAEEHLDDKQVENLCKALKVADYFLVASQFTAKGLIDIGISPERIHVVPYGSAHAELGAASLSSSVRWTNMKPIKLLWVGQLAYRKGAHYLFEALGTFSSDRVQLSLVTKSRVPDELLRMLPKNVTVFHSVNDSELRKMYLEHHLFVLPSLAEGFGLVYLEALSMGLPILATHNTGAADIIQDQKHGFIIEPGQVNPIKQIIDQCLKNPNTLQIMSTACFELAQNYTWQSFRENIRISLLEMGFDLSHQY